MKKYWEEESVKLNFGYSKSIIAHYAKSFYFSAQFLPKDRRWAAYAVYSFCRFADNIIDNPRNRSNDELLQELDSFSCELQQGYKYGESEHPALSAFIKVAKIYNIPLKYPLELIEGVKMDLTISHYNTFDELYLFAYRVAAVVGLMMTYILGFEDEETLVYAEKLGIAMQLTNILRDVKEDKELGRIYLPKEDLIKFNVTENDIHNENFTKEFQDLMKFQVSRALEYYKDAEPGIAQLNTESQFAIYTSSRIYGGILNKLIDNCYNPFIERASLSLKEKFVILLFEVAKGKLKKVSQFRLW